MLFIIYLCFTDLRQFTGKTVRRKKKKNIDFSTLGSQQIIPRTLFSSIKCDSDSIYSESYSYGKIYLSKAPSPPDWCPLFDAVALSDAVSMAALSNIECFSQVKMMKKFRCYATGFVGCISSMDLCS